MHLTDQQRELVRQLAEAVADVVQVSENERADEGWQGVRPPSHCLPNALNADAHRIDPCADQLWWRLNRLPRQ